MAAVGLNVRRSTRLSHKKKLNYVDLNGGETKMSDQDVDVDILDLDMEGASMSEGEDGETVDVDQEVDTELKGIEDIRLQVMEALKKKEERKKTKRQEEEIAKVEGREGGSGATTA